MTRLYDQIIAKGIVSVAVASRARIDRMNILRASLWAMSRAVRGLSRTPDHVIVDGNMLPPDVACRCEAMVDGDALSISVAAASIIAKVTRDRLMARGRQGVSANTASATTWAIRRRSISRRCASTALARTTGGASRR